MMLLASKICESPVLFNVISRIGCLCSCPFPHVSWRFWIPAGGSVPRDYLTQTSIQAVVGLHLAGALAGQTPHGAVAWVTQTLRLLRPAVHHATRELVARQELAGVCLVGWWEGKDDRRATLTPWAPPSGFRGGPEPAPHLVLLPKTDCRSQCRAAWRRRCRSPRARSGPPGWRYTAPACPASSCCSPPRCHSWSWGFPAAWTRSDWTADTVEAGGGGQTTRAHQFLLRQFDRFLSNVLKIKKQTGGERWTLWGHVVSTWAIRLMKCCWCQSERPESSWEEGRRLRVWPPQWHRGRRSISKGLYIFHEFPGNLKLMPWPCCPQTEPTHCNHHQKHLDWTLDGANLASRVTSVAIWGDSLVYSSQSLLVPPSLSMLKISRYCVLFLAGAHRKAESPQKCNYCRETTDFFTG